MNQRVWIASFASAAAVLVLSFILSFTGIFTARTMGLLIPGLLVGLLPAVYSVFMRGLQGVGIRISHIGIPIALLILAPILTTINASNAFLVALRDTVNNPIYMLFAGYMLGSAVYERDETRDALDITGDWVHGIVVFLCLFFLTMLFTWLAAFEAAGVSDPNNVQGVIHQIAAFVLFLLPLFLGFVPLDWSGFKVRSLKEKMPFGILALLSCLFFVLMVVAGFHFGFPNILPAGNIGFIVQMYNGLFTGHMAIFGYTLFIACGMLMRRYSDAQRIVRKRVAKSTDAVKAEPETGKKD